MSSVSSNVDVIIIGAGLAGLSAAKRLADEGKSFVILEANTRLGGRIYTEHFGQAPDPTYWIDNGAQWIGQSQEALRALIDQYELPTIDGFPSKGKALLYFNNRRHEFEVSELDKAVTSLMAAPLSALKSICGDDVAEFIQALGQLDGMAKNLEPGYPWRIPQAKAWDSLTVQNWLDNNLKTAGARFLLKLNIMLGFASAPSDLSLLHFLHYIRCAGSVADLQQAQTFRMKKGAVDIIEAIEQELIRGHVDSIHLDTEVRDVIWDEAHTVTAIAADGRQFKARHLICAIAPAVMSKIRFLRPHPEKRLQDFKSEQLLPGARIQLNQRMPMGSSVKFHAVYERPFWRDKGYSGIVVSDEHPVTYMTDNSNTDGSYEDKDGVGIIGGFFDVDYLREHLNSPIESLELTVANTIEDIYAPLIKDIPSPIAVHVQRWADEPWAGGCYAGIMPTGVWTGYKNALRDAVGPIHFASTETATKWFAYMDGAINAGIAAAEEILES